MQLWFTSLGRFRNLTQRLSLFFSTVCDFAREIVFPFYAVNTKKNAIGKQMLPVARKDKVELTLKAGGPQRW